MISLAELSVVELLQLYARIVEQLRGRGVCRSSNNPVADYTEWLVSSKLGLELRGNSASGFDAVDAKGTRYQIKGRRLTKQNPSTQLSQLRRLDGSPFDLLAGVVYNPDFSVAYAALVPLAVVRERSTFSEHTNAYIFHMKLGLLSVPGVVDITPELAMHAVALLTNAAVAQPSVGESQLPPNPDDRPGDPETGAELTQRDFMRELVRRHGRSEEVVIREYAEAERRGEVLRQRNEHGLDAETYARALWRDGMKKGWLYNFANRLTRLRIAMVSTERGPLVAGRLLSNGVATARA